MTLQTEPSSIRDDTWRAKTARLLIAGLVSAAAAIGIALSRLPSYAVALAFTGAASLYALRLRWRD